MAKYESLVCLPASRSSSHNTIRMRRRTFKRGSSLEDVPESCRLTFSMNTIQITYPTEQEMYTLCSTYQKFFLTPQFEAPVTESGWLLVPCFHYNMRLIRCSLLSTTSGWNLH